MHGNPILATSTIRAFQICHAEHLHQHHLTTHSCQFQPEDNSTLKIKMGTEDPDYGAGWPDMPEDGWKSEQSDSSFELGWISGLHKTANNTLNKLYGNYSDKFSIPDNLEIEFEADTYTDGNVGPVIYLAAWLAVLAFFAITGFCWCLCNKCCCCCRSSFKGRSGRSIDELENTDPHYQLRPYYSERNASKKSKGITATAVVISILMAVWLIGLLIVILHTFAANDKTKDATGSLQPHLDNAVDDLNTFIDKAREQLTFTFNGGYDKMSGEIEKIVSSEECPRCGDDLGNGKTVQSMVKEALDKTNLEVTSSTKQLDDALAEVQNEMNDQKENIDGDYEDIIDQVISSLYWFFMLFNLLYCLIFLLILVGVVLAAYSGGSGMKTGGFLIIRVAVVLMFIVGILVIIQLMAMFTFAGVASEIICPAIKELEERSDSINNAPSITNMQQGTTDNPLPGNGDYEVPVFGKIYRACKKDDSAYLAFNLQTAYDVENIKDIVELFDIKLPIEVPELDPIIIGIKNQVSRYAEFVGLTIKNDMGKCKPVYTVINSTVSLFCDKLTAPVASYWWILQFAPPIFFLIFLTAMFFERLHS